MLVFIITSIYIPVIIHICRYKLIFQIMGFEVFMEIQTYKFPHFTSSIDLHTQ